MNAKFNPGQRVCFGDKDEIFGTIEEVIFARGMRAPFYLVEYWMDGELKSRRLHEGDLR